MPRKLVYLVSCLSLDEVLGEHVQVQAVLVQSCNIIKMKKRMSIKIRIGVIIQISETGGTNRYSDIRVNLPYPEVETFRLY